MAKKGKSGGSNTSQEKENPVGKNTYTTEKRVNIFDLFPDDAEAIACGKFLDDNLNGC